MSLITRSKTYCMSKTKIKPIQGRLNSQVDVIVVGAGSGGISAAVQAARMGSATLLIEPSANAPSIAMASTPSDLKQYVRYG